jgi:hypothetical protein
MCKTGCCQDRSRSALSWLHIAMLGDTAYVRLCARHPNQLTCCFVQRRRAWHCKCVCSTRTTVNLDTNCAMLPEASTRCKLVPSSCSFIDKLEVLSRPSSGRTKRQGTRRPGLCEAQLSSTPFSSLVRNRDNTVSGYLIHYQTANRRSIWALRFADQL